MILPLLLIFAYVLGAIPFGVLVARRAGVDIMRVGSGNTGATNVWRTLGPTAGVAVFVMDVLKGLLPALAGQWLLPGRQELWFLAGAVAVVGHSASPFLRFKGGKGVSTALGMVAGSSPLTALAAFALFLALLLIFRFVSLASLIAVPSAILFGLWFHDSYWLIGGYVLLALFVFYRHRANIRRLRDGVEPRFSFRGLNGSSSNWKGETSKDEEPKPGDGESKDEEPNLGDAESKENE